MLHAPGVCWAGSRRFQTLKPSWPQPGAGIKVFCIGSKPIVMNKRVFLACGDADGGFHPGAPPETVPDGGDRSEEHTSELQSLIRISYDVFFFKKKRQNKTTQ